MVLEENECDSVFEPHITEEHVDTQYGKVHCIMMGTPRANRPVILTYHDVGLNHKSCFDTLFTHEDMQEILRHFPVCHVEAPGQHEAAKTLPTSYSYPTMDQLSEALPAVLKHFGLRSVIGLGVGAGACILATFALNHPDLVDGLVLININPNAEGLIDTVANKITEWTHTLPDTIITHLFGKEEIQCNHDLIATYRHHITTTMNQHNVGQFFRAYNSRSTLEMERPVPGENVNVRTLKCCTLLLVGDNSPFVEVVVDCNSKLNPTKTTLLKMADCGGLPQVAQPAKVIEAFKYFIQGLGYLSSASMTRLRSRTTSSSSVSSLESSRSRAHEKRGRSHTDVSMESLSITNMDRIISKSTHEVTC
ncbi:protein NDRG1-like isoform X1 [Phyllopteryx taeniolatus]|uniref:protein NDRG1-like isoform X1 n=1 Tax=Phyllopteryx taeniolatus TaxID=161469 RepID=UPI002AD24A90|nr:protein NDRG1-like isoform X1 [Phyllopteryx taeniolatus]